MKVYHSSKDFPASLKNPVVALGNFDGVHLAHQKLLELTHRIAKKIKGHSVVYTFDPHPVKVLAKDSAPPLINTSEQKLELFSSLGIERVIMEPFSLKFGHMAAEDWFNYIILQRLHAAALVAGYDFTFGRKRIGTVETLHELCAKSGLQYKILDAQLIDGTLISSSQIRQFISKGEMKHAKKLLGRPYFVDGKVVTGMGRGATLGIHTANLKVANELLPLPGVYVCYAKLGGKKYQAVTNVGMNPTFGGKTLNVEAHLLNFKKNIYHKNLRLYFLERLRDEKDFASPEELVMQIHEDIKTAKRIFKRLERRE